jgi:invasion protein IalB
MMKMRFGPDEVINFGGYPPSRRRHFRTVPSTMDIFLSNSCQGLTLMGASRHHKPDAGVELERSMSGLPSAHVETVPDQTHRRSRAAVRFLAYLAPAPVLLALVIVLGAFLGGTATANAQGAVKSVHGDWQIRCDTPPGAQAEQCALIQSVVAEDRSNAGLTVIILKTADQKSKLMRVVAPLGVLLPSGLGLKLDNADVGRAGFVRCLPNGCVAEVVMDDNLLNQLKTAKTATFIIFETPEEGIGFPLSLKGIGEGYDKLP